MLVSIIEVIMSVINFEQYLMAIKAREEMVQPLKDYLEKMNEQFYDSLREKFTKRTAEKHTSNIELFIMYLCDSTNVIKVNDITKGILNSKFRAWCRSKVWGADSDHDIHVSLRKFLQFALKQNDENYLEIKRCLSYL